MFAARQIAFGKSVIKNQSLQYLCFTAEQANSTIAMSAVGSAPTVYLETSTNNGGTWSDFTVGSTTITLANVGDKIYFRAKQDNNVFATSTTAYHKFVMTGKIAASGNLNTLLKADGSIIDLTGRDWCYFYMFLNCTSLTQAPKLPATTLGSDCYDAMFYGCTSLTSAPELPATTLTNYCYYYMFYGCTSLTSAPTLPATTLATYCYSFMFQNCTSLTSAPELPATTLTNYCYNSMFRGCTSLTQAPNLPATTLATRCYGGMFRDCKSLTQAPALPATTLATNCYIYMFRNCTSLTQAPELPAETLAASCYYNMFYGCSKLNSINVNFSAWNPSNATTNWVSNVASSGTFTCPANLPREYGNNRIPNGWTVV